MRSNRWNSLVVLGLILGLLMLVQPGISHAATTVSCSARGQVINQTPGQAETIGSGVWYAGVVMNNNVHTVGSNLTSAETTFNYSAGPLYGTKGFCGGNNAAEAQLTAIELAQGERANAIADDPNRIVLLYSTPMFPNDERSVDLTVLDPPTIHVGDVVTGEFYAKWSTKTLVEWGDGQSVDLGYQVGAAQAQHIYATAGLKTVKLTNQSGKSAQLVINVLPAVQPEVLTGSISTNKTSYVEGEKVTAVISTSLQADVTLVWSTGDEFGTRLQANTPVSVDHVFAAGIRSATIRLLDLNRNELAKTTISISAPVITVPTITMSVSPTSAKHNELVTMTVTAGAGNADFVGDLQFGDGQSNGLFSVQPGQSVSFTHRWVNQTGAVKSFLIKVVANGATAAQATLKVSPEGYKAFLPLVVRADVSATVTTQVVLNYPDGGHKIRFTVSPVGGKFVGSLSFGDGANTGTFEATLPITFDHDLPKKAGGYAATLTRQSDGAQIWTGTVGQ